MKEKIFQSDFLKRFSVDPIWKNSRVEFDRLLGEPQWVFVGDMDAAAKDFLTENIETDESCLKKILELFKKAKSSGEPEEESCCIDRNNMVLPVCIEDKNYGYISVVHYDKKAPHSVIKLLKQFVEIFALKSQKDLELERLYETIGPRTLALSTIHTLHRAMSSNLNLDELLPRIARLSLQILGATISKIYLFDKKKGEFLLKVNINLKDLKHRPRKVKFEEEIISKVVKSALSVLKDDVIAVPLVEEDVLGVILVTQRSTPKPFTYFDQDILATLAEQAVIAIKNAQMFEQQERLTLGSIRSISSLLKIKEGEWHSHTPVFMIILAQLARKLKLSKEESVALQKAGLLHDIEKASIPDKILKKEKPLTEREFVIIRKHPIKTIKILKPLHSLEAAIPIILHHHERYDGTGYPFRLKGEQIPVGARILAVADAFEAMITDRPWRKAFSVEQAVSEITKNSGAQFDPLVVEEFLKVVKDPKITKKFKNRKK